MISSSKVPSKSPGRFRRYKLQQNAASGGFLLMLSSGIHIGHGFFAWESVSVNWTQSASSTMIALSAAAWFIGGIFGFIAAPTTSKFVNTKMVYLVANSFVVISAILLIAVPQFFWAIFSARLMAGIGHGLAYVIAVQHFGEICDDKVRGWIGTSLHFFLIKGGIISMPPIIRFFSGDGRMDPNRFLGIFSLCLTFFAIFMTLRLHKESVLTLIRSGRDSEAIQTMILLRGEVEETPEITEDFNEMKMMVAEDKISKSAVFVKNNLRPLLIVLLLRVAFVLSFNYSLKYIRVNMMNSTWIDILVNVLHTIIIIIVMITIDRGRRNFFLISSCGTSVVMIIFGSLRASVNNMSEITVVIMFTLFELLSAVGLGLTAHIYSTEVFATTKKSASIALTSIFEFILQILFIVWVDNQVYFYSFDVTLLLTCGLLLAFISIYLFFNLPETNNVSIRKTRAKFLN